MTQYSVTIHIKQDAAKMRESYRSMSRTLDDMDGRSDGLGLELNYFSEGQLRNVKASCNGKGDMKKVDMLVEYMLGYIPKDAVEKVEKREA